MRVVDRDEKRKMIIEAARELFNAKGYNAVTTREIARSAGISKGGFYDYFANKEDLLIQTVSVNVDELLQKVEDVLFSENRQHNALDSYFQASRDFLSSSETYLKLLFDTAIYFQDKKQFHEMIIPLYEKIRQGIAILLKNSIPHLHQNDEDYHMHAMIISAFVDGIFFQKLIDPENRELDRVLDFYFQRIEQQAPEQGT